MSSILHPIARMRTVDPAAYGVMDTYRLMVGLIVPRPVALVSTVDSDGVPNLAPFSFFNGVGSNPPTVMFCPTHRAGAEHRKDTLRNVEQTGEFVINVVSAALAEAANITAAEVGPEIDEFELSGLTAIPSEVVRPPRVAESPGHFECKLLQIIHTRKDPAPGAGVIVLGEIVRLHVDAEIEHNFRVDPDKLDAVGRMAGNTWAHTRDRFDLARPK
jgi:flavin reductase (DIM6/NTAB) family NADH-FMN oxidoreductase RutF